MERFVAHLETPAVVDVLYRIIQCEEHVPDANVIDWLASQDLISRVVDLLSPHHSSDLHNTVSELLKAIIALSAPSPANLTQNQGPSEAFGLGGSNSFGALSSRSGVNNRLVRELANDTNVRKMVGFMLDFSIPSQLARKLSQDASVELEEKSTSASEREDINDMNGRITPGRRPLDPSDTPAASSTTSLHLISDSDRFGEDMAPIKAPQIDVTPESCTSSLVTCIGVLIELIRKNNSDYFEQHLFHTLRTHLLQRQQEIADKRTKEKAEKKETEEMNAEEDDEMEGMEEAMAEMSNELGIVHLGPMLKILCERLPDFQQLLMRSKDHAETVTTSLGTVAALTFERYRITELYAELLHCSNMALLNRIAGEGPQYNENGILQGGIEGLQILARTLQGGDGSSESAEGGPNDSTTADITLNENLLMTPIDSTIVSNAEVPLDAEQTQREAKASQESEMSHVAHSRDTTKHTREAADRDKGPDDVEDEALLSEISLSGTLPGSTQEASDVVTEATTEDMEALESKEESSSRETSKAESNLSTSSHAEVTLTAASSPTSPLPLEEEAGTDHVVGDLLKMQFLRSNVIDTILTLFFAYPWNNFLHNVVYDILQQFFNGRMDLGLNRRLTLAVFEKGRLTEKIVEGHQRNEESLSGPRKIRMGYMGHMNLIAEEVVKLLERYPEEVENKVKEFITPSWQEYVNETLKENREKEAAPLAGGRPTGGFSIQSGEATNTADGNLPANMQVFVNYLKSQMGDGSTSDDDEDDDDQHQQQQQQRNTDSDAGWMSRNTKSKQIYFNQGEGEGEGSGEDGFEDAFQPISSTFSQGRRGLTEDDDDDEDDDEWGPFADSSDIGTSSHPNAISSAQAYLTPADWASDFQRSTAAAEQDQLHYQFEQGEEVAGTSPTLDGERGQSMTRRDSTDSSDSSNSTPFIDLLDSTTYRQTDVVAAAHARRPSLGQLESPHATSIGIEAGRRASTGSGSSDPSVANAIDEDEPLGPGVSPDVHSNLETGMMERVIDGKMIQVPLDDVALVSQHEAEAADKGESAVEED